MSTKAKLEDTSNPLLIKEPVNYDAIFKGSGHREPKSVPFAQETVLGECRNPKRFSWVEWVFLVVSSLSLLAVLGVTIERLVYFRDKFYNLTYSGDPTDPSSCNDWVCTNDSIFAFVTLVNIGFCAFYCFDGLFRERPFEILAYVAATALIVLYIIVNYIVQNWEQEDPLRIARLALVCVLGPINIALAPWSWWKMGYLVLNVIGSNQKLIRAYRFRSFFLTLQVFHLELFTSLLVLALAQKQRLVETWELVILALLLPYMFFVALLGALAVLWEYKLVAYIWYGLIAPCGVYYLYKLIEVGLNFSAVYDVEYDEYRRGLPMAVVRLTFLGIVLLLASVAGLLVLIALVVFMSLSLVNFGKGLKDRVHPPLRAWLSRQRGHITNDN